MNYVFPGIQAFIDAEAELAGVDAQFVGPARAIWHVARIQDVLGQLSGAPESARAEGLAHVAAVRDSLAAALAGVDAAIDHARAGVDMIETEPSPKKRKGKAA